MDNIIWITLRDGRRVPIKPGMKGKFKKKYDDEENKKESYREKWEKQASKMEKYYDEFGTYKVEDEKKLNELGEKRDKELTKYYEKERLNKEKIEEKKYKKEKEYSIKQSTYFGDNELGKLEASSKEQAEKEFYEANPNYKNGKYGKITFTENDDEFLNRVAEHSIQEAKKRGLTLEEYNKQRIREGLKKEGMLTPTDPHNPKEEATKIIKETTRVRSTKKEVVNKIRKHINEHYGNIEDLVHDMDAAADPRYDRTSWHKGSRLVEGGSFLIYNGDMSDELNKWGLNPTGKQYDSQKSYEMYKSLVGREAGKMYDEYQKRKTVSHLRTLSDIEQYYIDQGYSKATALKMAKKEINERKRK